MTKTKKRILIVVVCLVLVGFGLFFSRRLIANANTVISNYLVITETVKKEISISGIVSAAQQQNLQALSAGTVVAVEVKKGDFVKKGDLLIQLDDTTEKYNLSKLDYDIQKTQLSGSSRELELMYMQRDSLVQKIKDRKIVAAFDGIIVDLNVLVGNSLEAKDTVGRLVDVSYLTAGSKLRKRMLPSSKSANGSNSPSRFTMASSLEQSPTGPPLAKLQTGARLS